MFNWFRMAFQRKGGSESAAGQQAPVATAYQAEEELQQAYRLLAEGQPRQAEACCRRALQADPGVAEAHYSLGSALRAQGRLLEAIASYRHATVLRPDYAQAQLDLGEVLSGRGDLDGAIIAFRAAASLLPDYAELHSNLGTLYRKRGDAGHAEACYREAIKLKPDFHAAHFNLGNLLRNQGRLSEAESCYQAALACKPDLVAAHHNLGEVLRDQGRFDEAMSCYERALTVAPDYPASRWHKTMLSLLTGDLQRGLPGYEYRWKLAEEEQPRGFTQPLWLGDADIRGKTILLYAEKGFGDTLQFVRYAAQVAALGAKVVLEVQAPLKSLLSAHPGMSMVIARGEPLPSFDYQCPLMSLPLAFKTVVATIPAASRYVSASPDRVTYWAGQLKQYRSPRIGLVWSGNIGQSNDMNRSMTLEKLAPLISGSRHHFFALVKEVRESDRALLRSFPNVTDLSPQLRDFSETAAILENLDLLITVDTSMAHLAGALGKPAWVMLSFVPDWRWFINRPDSPWYPSLRLFRQPAHNDWGSVVESLRTELDLLYADRREFSLFKKAVVSTKRAPDQPTDFATRESPRMWKVLNVGGNSKEIQIPELYNGWQHVMLDIDPAVRPDVICDARNLATLKGSAYDSVYCSHNLEHYFHHDVSRVLAGFLHVLKDEGFVYIRVPDMGDLMRTVVRDGLDIEDVLYQSPAGPIAVMDVIYGLRTEIARSGNDFFAHKTGFTRKSLAAALRKAGFPFIFTRAGNLEITAVAFKNQPNAEDVALLKLPEEFTAEPDPHRSVNPDPTIESANLKRRGNELLSKGELEEAADCYRQAIAINPRYAEAYLNLGFVLREQKLYEDADRFLRQATQINPKLEDAYYIRGGIAEERSDLRTAVECLGKALEINPAFEIACRDLCRVLFKSGQYSAARTTVEKGLSLNPGNADFQYYLGNLCIHEKQFEQAIACYQKALSIRPDYAEVHSNMGKALMELGRFEESTSWYRKALGLGSEDVTIDAVGSLLFARSYENDFPPEQYLVEARCYGDMVLAKARPYQEWPARHAGQPLRVGMVSADFLSHPVGFFLESVLTQAKSAGLEFVAYPTVPEEDDLTARIKPAFSAWHPISDLGDEAAARRIRDDGIQILIDLSGHTSNNRLPVFAWKPAPVQVSWLGYFASTGVPGMDYLLADKTSVPESHRAHFTETVWYLPDTRLCFTPPTPREELKPTPLPALRNGHITFGCFQNLSKINDGLLAVWGRIFKALPQARLRVQCKQLDDVAARDTLQRRLSAAGIPPERVMLEGPVSRPEYLAAHAEIDSILDTFPYPGGTTTCEALWMGVPTLTLAGNTLLSRQGASLLTCAGLGDWVAHDEAEYIEKAVALTSDLDRLAQLRAGLRDQVLASPLFDAPRFAANLETALREMWQSYLGGGA